VVITRQGGMRLWSVVDPQDLRWRQDSRCVAIVCWSSTANISPARSPAESSSTQRPLRRSHGWVCSQPLRLMVRFRSAGGSFIHPVHPHSAPPSRTGLRVSDFLVSSSTPCFLRMPSTAERRFGPVFSPHDLEGYAQFFLRGNTYIGVAAVGPGMLSAAVVVSGEEIQKPGQRS
jgi:hypothetical protein